MIAYKAISSHLATVEAARNQHVGAVHKALAPVWAPVREAISTGKEPRTAAAHAVTALHSQKETMALAVAHAYETVAAPMAQHALNQIASATGTQAPKDLTQGDAFTGRVTQYVAGILPDYVDRVLASFMTHAGDVASKALAARAARITRPPITLVLAPSARRGGAYRARAYKTTATPHKPAPAPSQSVEEDEGEGEDDITNLFDDLDGLVTDAMDMMAEMIAVTAGNLGMLAGAGAYADSVGIALAKVWQALEDSRTRPDHADANGQSQALEDPFDVGDDQMLFPLDESLGAGIGNIIYCRCVVVFEPVAVKRRRDAARRWSERILRIVYDNQHAPRHKGFNPDQPRDSHGRFGSGGGDSSAADSGESNESLKAGREAASPGSSDDVHTLADLKAFATIPTDHPDPTMGYYTHAVRYPSYIDGIQSEGIKPDSAGNVYSSASPLVRDLNAGYVVFQAPLDGHEVSRDVVENNLSYEQHVFDHTVDSNSIVRVVREVPLTDRGLSGPAIREDHLAEYAASHQGLPATDPDVAALPEKYQKWFSLPDSKGFNPDQPRDAHGRFGSGGGGAAAQAALGKIGLGKISQAEYDSQRSQALSLAGTHLSETDQAAMKQNVAQRLNERLQGNADWAGCVNQFDDLGRASGFDGPPGEPAAALLVSQWAASSGDSSELSIALQNAAQSEFGLDASTGHLRAQTDEYHYLQPGLQAFVRAQYDETQEVFARNGITSVPLFRGVAGGNDFTYNGEPGETNVNLQPVSSFTADEETARYSFSEGYSDYSTVMAANVPASRILSCPASGWGCANESEYTVLGGKNTRFHTVSWRTGSSHHEPPLDEDIIGMVVNP